MLDFLKGLWEKIQSFGAQEILWGLLYIVIAVPIAIFLFAGLVKFFPDLYALLVADPPLTDGEFFAVLYGTSLAGIYAARFIKGTVKTAFSKKEEEKA